MIRQLTIIFGLLAVAELIVYGTGIRFPSSLIAMLLLVLLLRLGIIRETSIADVAGLLLQILPFLFVPVGVSVMLYGDLIGRSLGAIALASLLSTTLTLLVTAWTHQWLRAYSRRVSQSKTGKEQ